MAKTKKGFTLVELLVVIAIIALLLSILMPSLQRAREGGKRAVCLSNLHQLTVAWQLYAESNGGKIVNGNTGAQNKMSVDGTNVGTDLGYGFCNMAIDAPGEEGWVGWNNPSTLPPSLDYAVTEQIKDIRRGLMYDYCGKNISIYKCPVGHPREQRTYTTVDSMNGWLTSGPVRKNILQIKRPSERIVFMDGGRSTLASWSISPAPYVAKWSEPPQSRHGDGTTFSFADGHSEYWKWTHRNTKLIGKWTLEYYVGRAGGWDFQTTITTQPPPNLDFLKIQRGVWGD